MRLLAWKRGGEQVNRETSTSPGRIKIGGLTLRIGEITSTGFGIQAKVCVGGKICPLTKTFPPVPILGRDGGRFSD
jgi:hypothetical protein